MTARAHPVAQSFKAVPVEVFVELWRRLGCVKTARFLRISPAAASLRASRLRAKGWDVPPSRAARLAPRV